MTQRTWSTSMLNEKLQEYINTFVLRKGERLEVERAKLDQNLMELNIIKSTERTIRIKGLLIVSNSFFEDEKAIPDQKLQNLKLTPLKKIALEENDDLTFRWLEAGWVMKIIRFENDEKTVKSSIYQMGYNLYLFKEKKLNAERLQTIRELKKLKQEITEVSAVFDSTPYVLEKQRIIGLKNLVYFVDSLKPEEFDSFQIGTKKWSERKKMKFLQFIVALIQLSKVSPHFDWKEIGAVYFKAIGGSKQFDRYKKEFIEALEALAQVTSYDLGLTSLGQITPVFFSGEMSGTYVNYKWGAVHALTDLLITKEDLKTSAKRVWLVENRAILTRLSATHNFLEDTQSLLICVDGHLRTSHKSAITQLVSNSQIHEIIIWSDYDLDGIRIANEIYTLVSVHESTLLKWVLPNLEIVTSKKDYEEFIVPYVQKMPSEQEMTAGSEEIWKNWIQG